MSFYKIGNCLFLVLLAVGCLSFARTAQALYWTQIRFATQVHSWETDVVRDFYAQRLKNAQSEFPGRPTEILVGRSRRFSEEDKDDIYVYLRGNPEFCSEEGCQLSHLIKVDDGKWQSEFEFLSNGYFMITDFSRGGRKVLLSETNTHCINLVWNESVYERFSELGPCEDRREAALDEAIDETYRDIYRAFRKNQISHGRVASHGATVTVSVELEMDRSNARTLLSDIAAKRGGVLQVDGNSFRLMYDFSDLPRFFVIE